MLSGVVTFLIKKAVEATLKGKKVDIQLFQCYYEIFLSEWDGNDMEDVKTMAQHMVDGIRMFDSYGNAQNMYASFCVFFNRILTKEQYRRYADLLVKKIVVHSELASYANVPVFKERIMEDFDPVQVQFAKTKLMIYMDFEAFRDYFTAKYPKTNAQITMNRDAGAYFIPISTTSNLKLDRRVFAYGFDTQLDMHRISGENIRVDRQNGEIWVKLEKRCNICFTNSPLTIDDMLET